MQAPGICLVVVTFSCMALAATGEVQERTAVGDDQLQVVLTHGVEGLAEVRYLVGGAEMPQLRGAPWAVETKDGTITPERDQVELVKKDTGRPARKATFQGEGDDFRWTLQYAVTGPGRITKSLTLMPISDLVLEKVGMWYAESPEEPEVASTTIQDIAAFYRHDNLGLFVSLDFPYSKIRHEDGQTGVFYPPHIQLNSGEAYSCHSLTIGATRQTGKKRYGFDLGEVDAMDAYIQERFEPRFERPMFTNCSINDRYCQVERGHVWYTYKDHPTLSFNTDLLKQEIAMMPKLGMEYSTFWPGVFNWVPGDPKPEVVKDIVAHARRLGVRVGHYSGASVVFGPHYNEYSKSLDRPEWAQRGADGNQIGNCYCFGAPDFVDYYINMLIPNMKEYGFEIHVMDFLYIMPCFAKDHQHPPGEDSMYHQVAGAVRVYEALNDVSPETMVWTHSGSSIELLPKIAWWNQNMYLTDAYVDKPWQGLNMSRILDDIRRDQMVTLHYSRFLPYRFYTNCQYFFGLNSIVPDIRNYEYGALSTLAVTPNISIPEIRPWIERLSPTNQERVYAFYKKWTGFIKDNFDLWKKTYTVGDNPGFGGVEVYSHAEGKHGYIFLVNPQYWDRVVEVPLGPDLGFGAEGKCELVELYPTEQLRLTNQGPYVSLGSQVPIRVPAQQVLVIEVRAAPKRIKAPRLYGVPGTIEKTGSGYLLKTRGEQGQMKRAAVLLPPGSGSVVSATVRRDVPKQPQRDFYETGLSLAGSSSEGALLDITFRRTSRPTELRRWRVREGSLAEGVEAGWTAGFEAGEELRFPLFINTEDESIEFPLTAEQADALGLGPLADFCGAYIDNAFYEEQETWIDLATGENSDVVETALVTDLPPERPRPLHPLAKGQAKDWWIQTSFHLPFMHMIGFEPFFDEHVILALPFLRPSKARKIEAWINGQPLEIQRYRYPRNRAFFCYWADLVGSGARGSFDNKIVLHLEY